MIKLLIKKNIMEIFRSFYYDSKKNRARSKKTTLVLIAMFAFLIIGIIGGTFAVLAVLVSPTIRMGLGWLYYDLMGILSISIGVFGSVFTTYSCLYLAKDNDLLLSLPISPGRILLSRSASVYLMGAMYASSIMLPAGIVYLVYEFSLKGILGMLVFMLQISVIVLILSLILGYAVARITVKVKRKGIYSAVLSIAFFLLYFVVIAKIQTFFQGFVANAEGYGRSIKGGFYPLYILGKSGEGDIVAMLVITLVLGALLLLTGYLLQRNYVRLLIKTQTGEKKAYTRGIHKQKKVFLSLLEKEFRRLLSSTTYMLNCLLGTVFMPLAGIFILVRGEYIRNMIITMDINPSFIAILLAGMLCCIVSMNDSTAASVSLEGKNIWILQMLPVSPWKVLKAKLSMHLLLTEIPLIFCIACVLVAVRPNIGILMLVSMILFPVIYALLVAELGLFMNLKNPNLKWTDEMGPTKQSINVMLVIFGGWACSLLFVGAGWLLRNVIPMELYMIFMLLCIAALTIALYRWLKKEGAAAFVNL